MSNGAVRAGRILGDLSRCPPPLPRAGLLSESVGCFQPNSGGCTVGIGLVLISYKSSGNQAREKKKGVICAVVAERWKIPLYDTSESLHVGQGGDGRPGWTPHVSSPRPTEQRASRELFSGPNSPIKDTSLGDFPFLQGQVTLLQDFSFSAAFAMGLLVSLLYRRCSRCAVFFLNHKSLCCLHGLIEALYVCVRLVDGRRAFAGGELEQWETGGFAVSPVWGN